MKNDSTHIHACFDTVAYILVRVSYEFIHLFILGIPPPPITPHSLLGGAYLGGRRIQLVSPQTSTSDHGEPENPNAPLASIPQPPPYN